MSEECPICDCGLEMTRNPHPDAGKTSALPTVGAWFVCIPCTVAALNKSTVRYYEIRNKVDQLHTECVSSMGLYLTTKSVRSRLLEIPS